MVRIRCIKLHCSLIGCYLLVVCFIENRDLPAAGFRAWSARGIWANAQIFHPIESSGVAQLALFIGVGSRSSTKNKDLTFLREQGDKYRRRFHRPFAREHERCRFTHKLARAKNSAAQLLEHVKQSSLIQPYHLINCILLCIHYLEPILKPTISTSPLSRVYQLD